MRPSLALAADASEGSWSNDPTCRTRSRPPTQPARHHQAADVRHAAGARDRDASRLGQRSTRSRVQARRRPGGALRGTKAERAASRRATRALGARSIRSSPFVFARSALQMTNTSFAPDRPRRLRSADRQRRPRRRRIAAATRTGAAGRSDRSRLDARDRGYGARRAPHRARRAVRRARRRHRHELAARGARASKTSVGFGMNLQSGVEIAATPRVAVASAVDYQPGHRHDLDGATRASRTLAALGASLHPDTIGRRESDCGPAWRVGPSSADRQRRDCFGPGAAVRS